MDLLEHLPLTSETLQLIAAIDEFKGRWQALGHLAPDRLSALRRVATIESVGSSTRIEGARLTDAEVDLLLSGLDVRSFRSRDEQEVAGYAAAMQLVFECHAEMDLTENVIRHLHQVLLQYSERDGRHRGAYKTHPNDVVAFAADGRPIATIFKTTSPFETPRRMSDLIAFTQRALTGRLHHPLLVIAVFVVRFLAVHPFQDGNGRLSRVLTTLLLLRSGYDYVPYSSLERVIEENKDAYYLALRHAQSTLDQGESKLSEWVGFFLRALRRQKDALAARIEQQEMLAPLAPLSAALLQLAREHGRLTVRAAVAATAANRNTVKVHLHRLVQARLLVAHGAGKGTWYQPAPPPRSST